MNSESPNRRCTPKLFHLILSLLIGAALVRTVRAAEFVEITTQLNSYSEGKGGTNRHTIEATCIVSTNRWFISGQFLTNAKLESWFDGTNVVTHTRITSSMYLKQAERFISRELLGKGTPKLDPISRYPTAGERYTSVSPLKQFLDHAGPSGAVWTAFCSGAYLKIPSRQVPWPVAARDAFGYADKTTLFEDDFGLPKRIELFATNGQLACKYEVIETTNFVGRTFPLRFRIFGQGNADGGNPPSNGRTFELQGRVISIKIGLEPVIPDDVVLKNITK